MNNNTPKSNAKKGKIAIIIILALLVIIGLAFAIFAMPALSDKAYKGVYVGDVDVGGMKEDAIEKLLEKEYGKYELNPQFSYSGTDFQIYGSQIDLAPDFAQTAKEAVSFGKDGNIFSKIKNMLILKDNPKVLNVNLTCDIDLLQYNLSEYLGDQFSDVEQYKVEYGEDCLILTNGKKGRGVDGVKVIRDISEIFTRRELNSQIALTVEDLVPDEINPEIFCEQYNRNPKDAECTSDGGNITITPEIVGVKINASEATKIINENRDNHESYIIPAVITYPDVTSAQLEAEFTDCVIGTYSTNYSTSSANRKENIRLASEKINGRILNPGEVFSFNAEVGPRTSANGYKVAHVYSGSKVVDGIGGGICQVSSTLYNAVVFADLEIVYRTNHSMPVYYVPLGRDATVSYGTIDFKFKNNKESPIKIEAIADGTNFTINVYGRKKYLKDITIENAITGSNPFSVVEVKDDTMYEDERKIEEKGSYGTNVVTYKVIRENDEIISKTILAKSSYTPVSQVERVGTKKRETTETTSPDIQSPSDAGTQDPHDMVLDNPPAPNPDDPIYELPVELKPPEETKDIPSMSYAQ